MKGKECDFCRVCVGICRKTVGMAAINITKQANGDELIEFLAEKCIACGSCAYICPTHAITMEDVDGLRRIKWPHNEMEFKLAKCKVCGNYWAPEKQIEYIARISGTPLEDYNVCPDCRD